MRTLALLAAFLFAFTTSTRAGDLVVHEWGTFTSLQDETGRAIGGLNSNDEPLPKFVHHIKQQTASLDDLWASKSLPPGIMDITMRLETPVLYFYPTPEQMNERVDVQATFNGGLLNEFFPNGETIPGIVNSAPRIDSKTVGKLSWKEITFGAVDQLMPNTNSHVWVAPRLAKSATPVSVGPEAEHYLFYRGVGHLDAPLQVTRDPSGAITIANRSDIPMTDVPIWLAEFRADGSAAFRRIDNISKPQAGSFRDEEFYADGVARLRSNMHEALVSAGLFPDEAEAMLETWKLSYFKSGGQRLFFLVPRAWTDKVLPLSINKPANLTRVMMGRIELITPVQRKAISDILASYKSRVGVDLTKQYASLGRFTQAIIQDAQAREQQEQQKRAKQAQQASAK